MRIGIDFDNTIVCYDPLFYELGVSKGLIPVNCPANKFAIRTHLSKTNRMKDWTTLQAEIYGREIWRADAFPGFFKFPDRYRRYKFLASHVFSQKFLMPLVAI